MPNPLPAVLPNDAGWIGRSAVFSSRYAEGGDTAKAFGGYLHSRGQPQNHAAGGQLPDRLPDGTEVKRGKVIRGGDFLSNAEQATTTYRRGLSPQGEKYDSIGFRCFQDLP